MAAAVVVLTKSALAEDRETDQRKAAGKAREKIPSPTVKGAGKIADEVPTSVPKNWNKADVDDAITDYERSVRLRKAEVVDFDATKGGGHTWTRKAHTERIAREEAFLRQLRRKSKDLQ